MILEEKKEDGPDGDKKDGKKGGPDGYSSLAFNILTRYFRKVGELRGRHKTEFADKFLNEYLFKKDRGNVFTVMRLLLPHVNSVLKAFCIVDGVCLNVPSWTEKEGTTA